MKKWFLTFIPAAVVAALAFGGWWTLRREHETLAAKRIALDRGIAGSMKEPHAVADPVVAGPSAALRAALQEVAAEEAALQRLKQQADELAARLPDEAGDEIVVSYGPIEDMAHQTGAAIQGILKIQMPAQDTPEVEKSVLQWMLIKGRVPEIQGFEDNPAEIASFQSRALREALNLPPAAEAALQPLIRDAFTAMAAEGLTARQRPAASAEGWIEKRSRALRQLMLKLRPHIPDSEGAAARQALTFVLNLGAGFESRQTHGPRQSMLSFGVNWPMVPW